MKKLYLPGWLCFAALLFSCASLPLVMETEPGAGFPDQNASNTDAQNPASLYSPAETIPAGTASLNRTPDRTPERPARPPVPEYIMGQGLIPYMDMAAFLLDINPQTEKSFIEDLVVIYIEEAAIEGVNHDAAFAQMCLETGFLRYGGLVTPDMNNFCGLGSTGPGQNGERFPDPRTGVRAHIQHLKAYATDAPLKQDLVDPRYRFVRYGSSPAIKGLSGTWATDRNYDEKISSIMERLYDFSFRD